MPSARRAAATPRLPLVRYGRDYAIVTCCAGCRLPWNGGTWEQPDGTDVAGLRALAREHAATTGHKVQFELTRLDYYMPEGTHDDAPEAKARRATDTR